MAGIGLTDAEIEAVKENWAIVSENLKEHGINIFATLFRTHPDYQQMFRRLKDLPLEDIEKEPKLRAHAFGFMKELSGMVENLDNKEELVIMIEGNARRHYRHKVSIKNYETVFGLFHTYLETQLGEHFTADAASGWKKITDAITDVVKTEFEAMKPDKQCVCL